jgi:hypothetical protein
MAGVVDLSRVRREAEYFCDWVWTAFLLICPSGKSPAAIAKQSPKFHIDVKADFLCSRQEFGQIEHLSEAGVRATKTVQLTPTQQRRGLCASLRPSAALPSSPPVAAGWGAIGTE